MGKKQMVAALCAMGMLALPVQAAENSPAPGRELYGILHSLCQLVRQQVLEEEPEAVSYTHLPGSYNQPSFDCLARQRSMGAEALRLTGGEGRG